MATQIISFTNLLAQVGARTTNLFELELNSGMSEVDKVFSNLTMYAQNFMSPKRSIVYDDLKFRGFPAAKIPTRPDIQQEISFDMWCDLAGDAQAALRYWQDSVIDMDFQSGSVMAGEKRPPLGATIRLGILDEDMESTSETITLHAVSIKDVGEIKYTNEDATIAKFNCSVIYLWPSYSK